MIEEIEFSNDDDHAYLSSDFMDTEQEKKRRLYDLLEDRRLQAELCDYDLDE